MWRSLCLCSLLLTGGDASPQAPDRTCNLFLAPSKFPSGPQNSVIAGRSFSLNTLLDSSPSLLVKTKPWMPTQLYDYLYEADELGYSYVLFGSIAQLNDDAEGNAEFDWANDDSSSPMKDLLAIAPISLGDEVVTGFNRQRRYNCTSTSPEEEPTTCRHSYTESELLEKGHCLSDLYLSNSTFPEAGQGVYSKVAYSPGATVHISPVIVLPTHTVLRLSNSSNSTLINFCLTAPGSDVALLPLGLGAMMNHPLAPASPNVRISWHSWDGALPAMLSEGSVPLNLTALELASEALLNIQYTALRDIAPGEELLMSYGAGWEEEWKQQRDDVTREGPLLVPLQTDIFPPSFASVCIGRNRVECNLIRNERRIAGNETLQRLQQEGKLLSDRLRSRVLARGLGADQRKKFNGDAFEKTEEPAVCQRRAAD
jgi:hypothetical protein